ncbi:hypothetical protein IRZ71_06400 [Flavobacterium sp. ANB]|uniref:hypothetical protein n=1 Tax=Flavobacterium sp. ANB TaxID=2783790 RepID=UPI00188AE42F|nr:hypothetical protein [Flavobacterium sp. ANB]MBF4515963.1 hypothetical protein [Flavobacterium sp. ANB]
MVNSEGILNEEYTNFLTEEFDNGNFILNQVFLISRNRILYIQEANQKKGGQGLIFEKEYFDNFVFKLKRMKEDKENGRNSNFQHWSFYSKNKNSIINKVDQLQKDLARILETDINQLNYSTKSLDLLSKLVFDFGNVKAMTEIYDNLVAYIGQVIKMNSKKEINWNLETNFDFPIIVTDFKGVNYNPINIVWEELTNYDQIDFRKAYSKEMRRIGKLLND